MAREVEADLVVNDKSDKGLDSAARKFDAEQEKLTRSQKRESDKRTRAAKKEYDGNIAELKKALGGAAKLVETVGPKLAQSLGKAVASSGDVVVPVLAGLAVAAAPVIGATIAGAIIGGVGLGGVVGGVLAASKDARVSSALDALSAGLQTKLTDAAGYFVEPTLDGIDRIKASLDSIDLAGIFKDASQFVAPLAAGVGDLLERLGVGIKEVMGGAGPVIGVIATEIGELGRVIGEGLASLADNGDDAASALQLVFGVINSSIQTVFTVVNGLTELYGILDRIHLFDAAHFFADLANAGSNGTQWIDPAAQKLTVLQQAAADAVPPLQNLSAQINELASAGQSLYGSTTQVGAAVAKLSQSIKENGRSLDATTAKGRTNREALVGLASALSANYQAYVKVNGEGRAANSVAGQNRAAFIKAAEGFNTGKAAAGKLADQLGLIPAKKSTSFNANTHDAAGRIAALQGQINALKGKTVTITVRRMTILGEHVSGTGGSGTQVKNAANAMWFASAGGGTSRTGGPLEVNSLLDLNVNLDGQPFRQMTKTVVSDDRRRTAYRQRVGAR